MPDQQIVEQKRRRGRPRLSEEPEPKKEAVSNGTPQTAPQVAAPVETEEQRQEKVRLFKVEEFEKKRLESIDPKERMAREVYALKNLIRIIEPGIPDQVLRVIGIDSKDIWMDKGPDREEWERVKREIFLKASGNQKLCNPITVGNFQQWTLDVKDVPTVDVTGG